MQLIAGVLTLIFIFFFGTMALPNLWSPYPTEGVEKPNREISPEVRLALDHLYGNAVERAREVIALKDSRLGY